MINSKNVLQVASFDIDGVIYNGENVPGIYPGPNDIIITGRSFEEEPETSRMLSKIGITNKVYYNPLPFDKKNRPTSGIHKAETINKLIADGVNIVAHYEDDPVQTAVIRVMSPVYVIEINNPILLKENVRHK